MSKTYTLIASSIKGGNRSTWRSNRWDDFSLNGTGESCAVGAHGDKNSEVCCTYILFDQNTLATLRSKNILSVTLSLGISSGTIPRASSTDLEIGYKLNADEGLETRNSAWARSDTGEEELGNYSVAYLRGESSKDETASNTPLDINLTGAHLPKYGYVLGPHSYAYRKRLYLQPSAILTVVTDENDLFYIGYNGNGGANVPIGQIKRGDAPVTLSETIPIWTGKRFTRWNTEPDGTGVTYHPGDMYYGNESVVLFAQWSTLHTTTISFNAKGGTGGPGSQTNIVGEPLTLSTVRPTKDGYRFIRWDSNFYGHGTSYLPGGTYSFNSSMTLYAQYVQDVDSAAYVKGSDNQMYQGTVYVKGSDGEMHISS